MQLESQLKLQKLKNELSQTHPMSSLDPASAHATEQPRYIAAFGIAPDYRGYLLWGEQIYPIYAGAIVRNYKVTELTPQAVKLRAANGQMRLIQFAFDTRIAMPQTDLPPLPTAINQVNGQQTK